MSGIENQDIEAIRHKKTADMLNNNSIQFPNAVVEIESVDHFNQLVNDFKENLIIIDFWAPWCGPCRAFAPAFKALQKEYQAKNVIFAKLNVDENQAIAQQFQVSGIPTTLFIRGKKLVHRQVGMAPKQQFAGIINTVLQKTNPKN
jgi:thioredoxin